MVSLVVAKGDCAVTRRLFVYVGVATIAATTNAENAQFSCCFMLRFSLTSSPGNRILASNLRLPALA